jgi:enoyl-CoA hydratase
MTDTKPSAYTGLTIERQGDIAVLTLVRPEVMNRVDDDLHLELAAAFRELDTLPGLRAAVFASTGKVFSAGGDFELMMTKHDNLDTRWEKSADGMRVMTSLLDLRVPLVAAVHGDAIGLGATLVLACDVLITHPTAKLSDPHVRVGLVAADGGCLVWPTSIGMMRSKKYLLTGDALTGAEALQMGLATDLVDGPDDVLPAAMAFAERLAALPPLAVQGTKRSLNRVMHARLDEVLELSFAYQLAALGSDDLVEAIASFKEKRKPRYLGR